MYTTVYQINAKCLLYSHVYEFYKWLPLSIREGEEQPLIASAAPTEPASH